MMRFTLIYLMYLRVIRICPREQPGEIPDCGEHADRPTLHRREPSLKRATERLLSRRPVRDSEEVQGQGPAATAELLRA